MADGAVERVAACGCGAVTARCRGEPSLVSLCHCPACQRRTGGPFGIAAFFPEAAVDVAGATHNYTRASDSGVGVTFHFCPTCGGTVYWFPHRKPGVYAVAVGAFADPGFPPPSKAVYLEHRHGWLPATPAS